MIQSIPSVEKPPKGTIVFLPSLDTLIVIFSNKSTKQIFIKNTLEEDLRKILKIR